MVKFCRTFGEVMRYVDDIHQSDFIECWLCKKLVNSADIQWAIFDGEESVMALFLCPSCFKKAKPIFQFEKPKTLKEILGEFNKLKNN